MEIIIIILLTKARHCGGAIDLCHPLYCPTSSGWELTLMMLCGREAAALNLLSAPHWRVDVLHKDSRNF